MDAELTTLEQKLEQLLSRHQALKAENRSLRETIASLEGANRALGDKVGVAASRLEALLARLGAEEES